MVWIQQQTDSAKIISAANERVEAELKYNGETFPLLIQKNEERNFDTSCNCNASQNPLCEHKVIVFLQLLNAMIASVKGSNMFLIVLI